MNMVLRTVALILYVSVQLLVEIAGQQTTDVTYDEIKMLNGICSDDNNCTERTNWDWLGPSKCVCRADCVRYDTCCLDSPNRIVPSKIPSSTTNPPVKCVALPLSTISHFMVTTCSPGWRGRRSVIRNCLQDVGYVVPRDPYVAIPAFDNNSGIHYKNYFCALCNDVTVDDLMFWESQWTVTEDGTGATYDYETFLDGLLYDDTREIWGFLRNISGKSVFQEVKMHVIYRGQSYATCFPDLISDCDPAWTDQTVREKCKAYMEAMFYYPKAGHDAKKAFRNVHCAMCNYVDLENGDLNCYPIPLPPKDPLSFTMLVDVNLRDGPLVGKVTKCKPGERFDQFAKKCRSLECGLPGYVIVRNRCVRA